VTSECVSAYFSLPLAKGRRRSQAAHIRCSVPPRPAPGGKTSSFPKRRWHRRRVGLRASRFAKHPPVAHRFKSVMPSRMAYFVSSATLSTLSFSMVFLRCVSTVLVLMFSLRAISFVL